MASLPIPRSGFGSAVMDNILYLCGGCNNLSKVSHTHITQPLSVGIQNCSKSAKSEVPSSSGRNCPSASCCKYTVVLCIVYYNIQVSTVDCYDPEKNEWTFGVSKMSTRRSSLGVGVAPTFLF